MIFESQFNQVSETIVFDIQPTEGFDFRSNAYCALYEKSDATAFQNPFWLDAHYRHVVPEFAGRPHIIQIIHRTSNTLVGIIPLVERRIKGVTMLEFADQGVCDYASPVIDRDILPLIATSELTCAAIKRAMGSFDHWRLKSIREDTADIWNIAGVGELQECDCSAHSAALQAPYSDWKQQAFSKSHSKYLNRRRRRAARETDMAITRLQDQQSIGEAIGTLATLRKGRFENDPIQRQGVLRFYQEVASKGAETGFAETWALRFDGRTAGVVFGITQNGSFHYLLIGADYKKFGRHSPGLLMYDAMMEDWCNRGGTEFDFTIGDEEFKANFGTRPIPIKSCAINGSLKGLLATKGMQWVNNARPRINAAMKITNRQ